MERIEKYCYTKKDFILDWFSGTGPGGQNRNKVKTCVRLTHIPSGIVTVGQRERTRTANLKAAFAALKVPLTKWIQEQINKDNPGIVISDEVIRTYHFADNRITDHASGMKIAASELDKRFSELVEARKSSIIQRKIEDENHSA